MSSMGLQIDQFAVPVCNSFKDKILNDQLCYEIDLDRFSNKDNIERELKLGFGFLMDYNEGRQVTFHADQKEEGVQKGLVSRSVSVDDDSDVHIYLNTIGRY